MRAAPVLIASILLGACVTSGPVQRATPASNPDLNATAAAAAPVHAAAAATDPRASPASASKVEGPASPADGNSASAAATNSATAADASDDETDSADDENEDSAGKPGEDSGEGESHVVAADAPAGLHYTSELGDAELLRLWKNSPKELGSMSVGFVDAGRLVNGVRFPDGEGWTVVAPVKTWATAETIAYVQAAIRAVRAEHPNAPALRVNQISAIDGGYLRPHQSHQNGRDVDLGFYYPTEAPVRAVAREKVIDLELNWALVKAIATLTDVQMILVDKRVQKVLEAHALKRGEDPAFVHALFHGKDALLKHARHHRDHFHVRFYNPRAQELGRRVAPLMAQQPEYNVAMHRVKNGDNLGALARKYGSTVAAIRKVNHMKSSFMRAGITLTIPLRGVCVHCPIPPAVIVPERRACPGTLAAAATGGAIGATQ